MVLWDMDIPFIAQSMEAYSIVRANANSFLMTDKNYNSLYFTKLLNFLQKKERTEYSARSHKTVY